MSQNSRVNKNLPIAILKGVKKSFGSKTKSITVLEQANLEIYENEFLTIIGPSGCGKTTLLRLLGGLIPYDEGTIEVRGKPPEMARKDKNFGFVFQDPVLLPWRSVLSNVMLPAEILGDKALKSKAESLIELVGLKAWKNHLPKELSGGMRSRVAIARALSYEPPILLMDEPFGNLDEMTRTKMNLELLKIWSNIHATVVFITHSIPESIFLSDRVAVMTPCPSRFKKIIEINFSRPRDLEVRETNEFIRLTKELRESLKI